jgi:hypothetical protein
VNQGDGEGEGEAGAHGRAVYVGNRRPLQRRRSGRPTAVVVYGLVNPEATREAMNTGARKPISDGRGENETTLPDARER